MKKLKPAETCYSTFWSRAPGNCHGDQTLLPLCGRPHIPHRHWSQATGICFSTHSIDILQDKSAIRTTSHSSPQTSDIWRVLTIQQQMHCHAKQVNNSPVWF